MVSTEPPFFMSGSAAFVTRDEGVGADVQGNAEAFAAGLVKGLAQLVAARVGNRMDDEVEAAPLLLDLLERHFDLGVLGDVAAQDQLGLEAFGERPDPFLEDLVEVRERDRGPFLVQLLRDAPGDALVIRHAENDSLFSCHQACAGIRSDEHTLPPTESEADTSAGLPRRSSHVPVFRAPCPDHGPKRDTGSDAGNPCRPAGGSGVCPHGDGVRGAGNADGSGLLPGRRDVAVRLRRSQPVRISWAPCRRGIRAGHRPGDPRPELPPLSHERRTLAAAAAAPGYRPSRAAAPARAGFRNHRRDVCRCLPGGTPVGAVLPGPHRHGVPRLGERDAHRRRVPRP